MENASYSMCQKQKKLARACSSTNRITYINNITHMQFDGKCLIRAKKQKQLACAYSSTNLITYGEIENVSYVPNSKTIGPYCLIYKSYHVWENNNTNMPHSY